MMQRRDFLLSCATGGAAIAAGPLPAATPPGKSSASPAAATFDAHVADFAQFRISSADYIKRLFIGHYSPAGNNFFATAMRKTVVDWLEPKPMAYQAGGSIIDFQDGYYLDRAPGVSPDRAIER